MQTYFRARHCEHPVIHLPEALLRLRLRRQINRAAREIHTSKSTRPWCSWMARRMKPADVLRRTPRRPRPPRYSRGPIRP